jgi:hypothetical protein
MKSADGVLAITDHLHQVLFMNGNLAAAFVINAVFYVLLQVTRIPLIANGGDVAWLWPERGVMWFAPCTRTFIAISYMLLIWNLFLPISSSAFRRALHLILVMTAALNVVLAYGNHGLMIVASANDFADTPMNRAIRLKMEIRKKFILKQDP